MSLLFLASYSATLLAQVRGVYCRLLIGSSGGSGVDRSTQVHRGFAFRCGRRRHSIRIGAFFHARRWCSIVVDGGTLSIGRNFFMNNRCSINCHESVSIGDNCLFGEGVSIYDHDHDFSGPGLIRDNGFKQAPISIGSNVWLGTNVIVLRGAAIGDNVVVGANTVIKGKIPSNSLVVGTGRNDIEVSPLRRRDE